MSSIRQFNRVYKSKVHWKLSSPTHRSLTCKQQSLLFIIHADSFKDLIIQFHKDLIKNLSFQLSDEDLSNALNLQLSDEDLSNALSLQLFNEDLSNALSTQLSNENLSKALNVQLYKNLNMNSSYQLQFLFENRADKFQN